MRNGGVVPFIRNVDPGQLYPRERTRMPIEEEAVWVPESVWTI